MLSHLGLWTPPPAAARSSYVGCGGGAEAKSSKWDKCSDRHAERWALSPWFSQAMSGLGRAIGVPVSLRILDHPARRGQVTIRRVWGGGEAKSPK